MAKTVGSSRGPSSTPVHNEGNRASVSGRTRSATAKMSAKAAQAIKRKTVDTELSVHSSQESSPSKSRPRKRRLLSETQLGKEMEDDDELAVLTPKKRKTTPPKSGGQTEEKRLRVFRKHAPQSYLVKLERAVSQRMFVINRTCGGTEIVPEQTVEMAGTTGNIYRITIGLEPHCTCPDNRKGNQCKHIVYVLHNVLKAPEHLQYQLAFLSSELREILARAPAPIESADKGRDDGDGRRKEIIGDCPICFMEFEPEKEEIVWCKAACGNNIHKHCFEQWAKSQGVAKVNCVYCRTPWQGDADSMAKIVMQGKKTSEGYVNVASQLGLSRRRDTSTYHQPWLRRGGMADVLLMTYDDYYDEEEEWFGEYEDED